MQLWRRLPVLVAACVISVACIACDTAKIKPASEEALDSDPPIAYFYRDGNLSFAVPECYGYVVGMTLQDVASVDSESIWRLGSPSKLMLGTVAPEMAGFRVEYGSADIAKREVDVTLDTTLYSFVFLRLPAINERPIPESGSAYLQDGRKVNIEQFVHDRKWCADFSGGMSR